MSQFCFRFLSIIIVVFIFNLRERPALAAALGAAGRGCPVPSWAQQAAPHGLKQAGCPTPLGRRFRARETRGTHPPLDSSILTLKLDVDKNSYLNASQKFLRKRSQHFWGGFWEKNIIRKFYIVIIHYHKNID